VASLNYSLRGNIAVLDGKGVAKINGTNGIDAVDFSQIGHAVWFDAAYFGSAYPGSNHQAWTRDFITVVDSPDLPSKNPWRPIADVANVHKFIGSGYDDYIAGDDANDTFLFNGSYVPGGDNHWDGRGGVNTADFSLAQYAVWVDLNFNDPHYWGNHQAFTQHRTDLKGPVSSWIEIADITNVQNLVGSQYDDYLYGKYDTGVLDGSKGNDQLFGGGKHNTFVFNNNNDGFGHDVVKDFYVTSRLEFDNTDWRSAADVLAHARQIGSDVVITLDDHSSVTLEYVRLTTLTAHPEVFVV